MWMIADFDNLFLDRDDNSVKFMSRTLENYMFIVLLYIHVYGFILLIIRSNSQSCYWDISFSECIIK